MGPISRQQHINYIDNQIQEGNQRYDEYLDQALEIYAKNRSLSSRDLSIEFNISIEYARQIIEDVKKIYIDASK